MTTLLKQVLKHQVYPAMGCTEPVSTALCAAKAASMVKGKIIKATIFVDNATYKNGLAVRLPNTKKERGNLLASALGLIIKKPELDMEILKEVNNKNLKQAKELIKNKVVELKIKNKKSFYIETNIFTDKKEKATAIICTHHTNFTYLSLNGKILKNEKTQNNKNCSFNNLLKKATLKTLIKEAQNADSKDLKYIKKGILMNLKISKEGKKLKKVGYYLQNLVDRKILSKNLVNNTKILCAFAADARMDGIPLPVMSSGESGNQGIVAILAPYNVGKALKIKEEIILKSIALSHLLNAYVKTWTGELAPICGCAIAAGVGAAAALVYQQKGADVNKITLAINNIISDIGGMLCDGAKSGCALKVVSSVDSALRAAFMAINNYGISNIEGFVGKNAQATIQNLSKISAIGMLKVDSTILGIMEEKTKCK
ncbi:MAG: serine dehydratase subunit alpha family protein [Elusimicrobiaceae bacterium]|nr:serine dehydratase subunit alpha family protein [Elusimicrobiaceae bacterium]